MKRIVYISIITAATVVSCISQKKTTAGPCHMVLDLQGHRGSRGLMPENTIPAMKTAIDYGVTTLELDVVISGDNKVVVSHDPFFNEAITTAPGGKHLSKKEAEDLLLYKMPYSEIIKYDVGLKPHPGFPQQKKLKVYKPLLSDLIDSIEYYAKSKGKIARYNIEIKSKKSTDNINHPDTKVFSDFVVEVIKNKNILGRTVIQSFDVRPLQYIHNAYPSIALSFLVERTQESLQEQLNKLGFKPNIYSPYYSMVTKKVVDQCHKKGIKVLPWTVNNVDVMNKLVEMGADGIISDYPNLFADLRTKK